ncbi:MAG: hypothetical protein ACE5F7_06965 [Nitrospiria bacterium]
MSRMLWGLLVFGVVFSRPYVVFPEPVRPQEKEEKAAPKVERLLMGGTEIQGTVEKPHVVYVVPWSRETTLNREEIPIERSFKDEILEPVDHIRFRRRWGDIPRISKGGEAQ